VTEQAARAAMSAPLRRLSGSLADAEPSGRKSRWRKPRWNAGRRARPQAEGGASRLTPWRVPHAACVRAKHNASAGVSLPFIFSWSSSLRASLSSLRAIAKQSTCSVRNLDCLVASAPRNDVIGKTRTRKNRAARTIFLSSPAMRGGMRWRVVKPRVLFAGHEFGISR